MAGLENAFRILSFFLAPLIRLSIDSFENPCSVAILCEKFSIAAVTSVGSAHQIFDDTLSNTNKAKALTRSFNPTKIASFGENTKNHSLFDVKFVLLRYPTVDNQFNPASRF